MPDARARGHLGRRPPGVPDRRAVRPGDAARALPSMRARWILAASTTVVGETTTFRVTRLG